MILGMKVRKHDLDEMLKFDSKILEFHFSDSDLNLTLESNFEKQLMVHCYEYFDRKIVDLVSFKETNQIHSREKSIELIQAAIDKTVELGSHFVGTPSIIVHPGGYSLETLNPEEIEQMKNTLYDSVKQLDTKNIQFLLENMPPYGWFFGGRWNSNIFLDTIDLENYCKTTGNKVCFDLCHSQLHCNKQNISLITMLLNRFSRGKSELLLLPMEPDRNGNRQPISLVTDQSNHQNGRFSPDGHWIVYQSDETGRFEMYIREFREERTVGPATLVTGDGGLWGFWSRTDVKSPYELIYFLGTKIMSVRITTTPRVAVSKPRPLFDTIERRLPWVDLLPDGRFLAVQGSEEEYGAPEIHVVLNYFEEIRRRYAAEK